MNLDNLPRYVDRRTGQHRYYLHTILAFFLALAITVPALLILGVLATGGAFPFLPAGQLGLLAVEAVVVLGVLGLSFLITYPLMYLLVRFRRPVLTLAAIGFAAFSFYWLNYRSTSPVLSNVGNRFLALGCGIALLVFLYRWLEKRSRGMAKLVCTVLGLLLVFVTMAVDVQTAGPGAVQKARPK